jgi:hypothetical protein
MLVIFSGEGPSDLGQSSTGLSPCCGADFTPGPMAALVDNAIEAHLDYSIFTPGMECAWFISETELARRAKQLSKRNIRLRGIKNPDAETGYFFKNAEMLGLFALEKEQELNDVSIAILFRDTDGTRSAPNLLWQTKHNSIQEGFARAQYLRGIAMLPKPKSESWLLCALRTAHSSSCADLENLSGNDAAPNSAKAQLDQVFGAPNNAASLYDWVKQNKPNFDHLATMPSFAAFATQLAEKLQSSRNC